MTSERRHAFLLSVSVVESEISRRVVPSNNLACLLYNGNVVVELKMGLRKQRLLRNFSITRDQVIAKQRVQVQV